MNFYEEWENCIENNIDDEYYINSFLYCSNNSLIPLIKSSKKEIKNIINFLILYDNKRIINKIGRQFIKQINPSDIIQFSNLEKSTVDITATLKYEPAGLTFEDLGYLLDSASNKLAATKYGENQSKTAKIFSLVEFSETRPTIVKNTSLGNEFPLLSSHDQERLLKILCLRDSLVLSFIAYAKYGKISYAKIAGCLSTSTMNRRRKNVAVLLKIALSDIDEEFIHNIEI